MSNEEPFLTKDPIGQKFLEQLKPYTCYGGLDLSTVTDLTAFVLAWQIKETIYIHPWFFIPEEGLAERSKKDNVPYTEWLEAGYLEVCPGSIVDKTYVIDRLRDLSKAFKILEVGYDNWGARDIVADLKTNGVTAIDCSQYISAMTAPSKRLESLVLSKQLIHTGHPLLRWNLDCVTIYSDVNANIKPIKPDRMKSSKRIDGVIALIMAISRVQQAKKPFKSIYSTRGVLTL